MFRFLIAIFALTGISLLSAPAYAVEVITLTQTSCQFVEAENGVDLGITSRSAKDCETYNNQTETDRLANAQVLRLKPGKYIFRVKNENVPYELGFWLRDADYNWKNPLHKLTKTSVSGGGLSTGTSQDYEVELKPGEYLYSCPLNPTPDYKLIVK
jgi:hypothetical protein